MSEAVVASLTKAIDKLHKRQTVVATELRALGDSVRNMAYNVQKLTDQADLTNAMAENHGDLADHVPFKSDEDVLAVMASPTLQNGLYAKVSSIRVTSANPTLILRHFFPIRR